PYSHQKQEPKRGFPNLSQFGEPLLALDPQEEHSQKQLLPPLHQKLPPVQALISSQPLLIQPPKHSTKLLETSQSLSASPQQHKHFLFFYTLVPAYSFIFP